MTPEPMPTRLRREAARWGDSKLAELLIQAAEEMEAAVHARQVICSYCGLLQTAETVEGKVTLAVEHMLVCDKRPEIELLDRAEQAEAQLAAIRDDPEMDGTDGAHPAWWRGHDQSSAQAAALVTKWLDGADDGSGRHHQPWQGIRERIAASRAENAEMQSAYAVLAQLHVDTMAERDASRAVCAAERRARDAYLREIDTLKARLEHAEDRAKHHEEYATKARAEGERLRGALEPFRSGGEWGTFKAALVHGPQSSYHGIEMAKRLTAWQVAVDAALTPASPGDA